ncbi:TonB-dependent siderophore receptor, partial [Pseudomonas syringae pv. tagetis]
HDLNPHLVIRGHFHAGGLEHHGLNGNLYVNFPNNHPVTKFAGGPYAIDIYCPVYGHPITDGALSGTFFYEHIESGALYLQDLIV